MRVRTLLATTAALVGFAANSILCRNGLGSGSIDAASFTVIRIAPGAATVLLPARFGSGGRSFRGAVTLSRIPSDSILHGGLP